MENKIYKKTCEICGKELVSLSESQLEYNFNSHVFACKKKSENKKDE